jgi:hypothetical protein
MLIFWNHYFKDFGFPWDFPLNYYAIVAFWTSLVRQGVVPSWIPFQSMGLPINLSLQSGIHYPVFWIFPIFKIDYSLHAAVIVQCLHILFGAIGMYLFLRLILGSNHLAILGAFIFQFFGGFYSNAEHADIIRAFSFAPWLLYFYTFLKTNHKYRWHNTLIPLGVLFLFTGGYPGIQISSILILGVYGLFQLIEIFGQKKSIRQIFWLLLIIILFSMIGIGLSLYHLGPAIFYKNFLYRSASFQSELHATFWFPQLPGLFLDNTVVPGEISMTSAFLTLPVLILLTFTPIAILKKYWYMAGILLVSFILAAGNNSFVGYFLWKFIPPLKYSRFPSSDYRIYIAIPLIFFAVLSLNSILENKMTWKDFFLRAGIAFIWFGQAIFISYPKRSLPVYQAVVIFLSTMGILFLLQFDKRTTRIRYIYPFVLFFLLISLDAARVLPSMATTWQVTSFSKFYQDRNWPLRDENGQLLTYQILQNLPDQRPARLEKERLDYSWEGYITGRFIYNDLVTMPLNVAHLIDSQEIYKQYMLQEWTPLFFDITQEDSVKTSFDLPPELIKDKLKESPGKGAHLVTQIKYGINAIKYLVSTENPYLMVENEIYFPGWVAHLESKTGTSLIQAVPVNGIFRAWVLPAGSYTMTTEFKFPKEKLFGTVSLISLLLWVILLLTWKRIINRINLE